jgi:serine/threonine protein kinase
MATYDGARTPKGDYLAYSRGLLLGEGAWFTVHAATHVPTGDPVVLKEHHDFLLGDPGYVAKVLAVHGSLIGIDHPDLVTVLDAGYDGERLWSAERFVNGRSLMAWRAEGWVTPELVLRVAIRVLGVLEVLHGRGIVHGCLHPGTIRMAGPDQPRLGDFGMTTADPGLAGPHSTGTFGFHQPYCDADVLAGRGPTVASDLFGVGVLLREYLAGQPVRDEVTAVIRRAVRRGGFADAAELAAALSALE